MHVFWLVSVKHGMIIHPECPFTVNLTKVVEVQLPHQTNNIIEKHKNRIDIAENICIAIDYKYSVGLTFEIGCVESIEEEFQPQDEPYHLF